jgi:hypothetical protein
MRSLILFFIVLLFLLPVSHPYTEDNILSLNTAPYGTFPMGSSSDYFKIGLGIKAEASFIPSSLKYFGFGITSEYLVLPILSSDNIWLASAKAGPVFLMPMGKIINLFAGGGVGYYYSAPMNWDAGRTNGGSICYSGAAGVSFMLKDPFSIGLAGSYDFYNKLYNGVGVSLYARFDFGSPQRERAVRDYSKDDDNPIKLMRAEKGNGVELRDIELITLFPVLYKYYDNNPIGTVRIVNFEEETAEAIRIQFFMERYMDNPMDTGEVFSLEPGEEKTIELFGLFTQDMMDITEGSKASARISISYTMNNNKESLEYNPVLELNNRNALTWDDDRKIASFITAKDPEILRFSKKVSNWMQEFENPAVDENLQKGMILFEAVKSYGVRYEIDPATPFATLSEQKTTVDFIQFPRQTLGYTTGDCDDLTALYSSMLESVGVETGIITIPGHIYMAFALKSSPEEIRKKSIRSDDFLYLEDKVWVPIEITMFQASFDEAWQIGAKEWRENESRDQAMFYATLSSWQEYQAVGFREDSGSIDLPSRSDVTSEFVKTISRFVDQEIYPQESALQDKMASTAKPYIYQNKLAVLYARYGLYDKALSHFEDINESRDFPPALLNTGNIYFIQKDYANALLWYDRVLRLNGGNKKALLGSARCNHELENYGIVKSSYKKLKSIDAVLAERFAYLDLRGAEGQRAADALGLKELVLWEEEE